MSYVKDCIFCKKQIKMSNDNIEKKWLPLEIATGEIHECKMVGSNEKFKENKPKPVPALTLEDLNTRLNEMDKRLKKIEFTLFGRE